MKKKTTYTISDLKKDFPTEEAFLNFIFDQNHNRKCSCGGEYVPLFWMEEGELEGRRQFQCTTCRFQIAPMVGTIFEKSSTSLLLWLHAIYTFSQAKSGISTKNMQRHIGTTYKCSWRILSQIRKALKQTGDKLRGDVEVDTGFFGGKGYGGKDNKNQSKVMAEKSVVIVAVERGGRIKAEVVQGTGSLTMKDFLDRNVETKATSLMTDATNLYKNTAKQYDRFSVNHHKGEYVRGDVHINTVETFFAHLKRSIKGTFKSLSKEHLQSYLDAFCFHFDNRHNDKERFFSLLEKLLSVSVAS